MAVQFSIPGAWAFHDCSALIYAIAARYRAREIGTKYFSDLRSPPRDAAVRRTPWTSTASVTGSRPAAPARRFGARHADPHRAKTWVPAAEIALAEGPDPGVVHLWARGCEHFQQADANAKAVLAIPPYLLLLWVSLILYKLHCPTVKVKLHAAQRGFEDATLYSKR